MYAATIVTALPVALLASGACSRAGFLVPGFLRVSLFAVWFLVRERRRPVDACEGASPLAGSNVGGGGEKFPPSQAIAAMWQTFREPGIPAIGAFHVSMELQTHSFHGPVITTRPRRFISASSLSGRLRRGTPSAY